MKDLRFVMPEGWQLLSAQKRGEEFLEPTRMRLPEQRYGAQTVRLLYLWGDDLLWELEQPGTQLVYAELAEARADYESDLAFYEAIYRTVPLDLKYAFGRKLRRLGALLWAKELALPLPVKRLSAPSLYAFFGKVRDRPEEVELHIMLFDTRGASRGAVRFYFDKELDCAEAQKLAAQLLWNSEFVGD